MAVSWGHTAARVLGDAAKRMPCSRSAGADALLDEAPARFDRVQVRRVGRQVAKSDALRSKQGHEPDVLVRRRVVEDDDVSRPELREEATTHPRDETLLVRGLEHGAHREP